jgi:2-iminobutanoate/2-iminopropanoate deaminase
VQAALLFAASLAAAADLRVVVPANGPKPVGPYSPGIVHGDYLYVSGQGSAVNGKHPESAEAQARACLINVKAIVEAAGFRMDQVVHAQLYLADIANYDAVNRVWPQYFPAPPARATLAVTRMPTDTPIEITVVAYKGRSQPVYLPGARPSVPMAPGMLTADRLYIGGILGRDAEADAIPASARDQAKLAFDRYARVLAAAKTEKLATAFLTVYHTAKMPLADLTMMMTAYFGDRLPPHAIVEVPALPMGANIEITGVAARYRKDRRSDSDCSIIRDTAFCALSEKLRAEDKVVATNVYIDSIDEFSSMNLKYAEAFHGKTLPTRTTVQPMPVGKQPKFRFSYVAVR